MTTRTVETPNPATPSASFPLVPLLKPTSGNLTLTATVYRDSGDDTPTLVTVKDQTGTTLGSTTLTTPAGNLTANILIPATALATCQAKPTIECTPEPPIQTSCCTEPIPRTLKVSVETTGTTGNAGTQNYSIRYNESIQTWVSTPSVGGACDDIFIYCHNNTLFVSQSGTCDNGTGFIPDINLESCSPFSLSFTYTADNPPGTDVVVTGTISAM